MYRPDTCSQSDVYGRWRRRIRRLSDGCFHNGSIYPICNLSLIHLQAQVHPSLHVGLLDCHPSFSDHVGVGAALNNMAGQVHVFIVALLNIPKDHHPLYIVLRLLCL